MVGFVEEGDFHIGKVTHANSTDNIFRIDIYRGSLAGRWTPMQMNSGNILSVDVNNEQITHGAVFNLSSNGTLPQDIKEKFKQLTQ